MARQTESPFRLGYEPAPDGTTLEFTAGDNDTAAAAAAAAAAGARVATISGGPPQHSMYLTALYFTMTCMTSIGFGNVAAETDSEKVRR